MFEPSEFKLVCCFCKTGTVGYPYIKNNDYTDSMNQKFICKECFDKRQDKLYLRICKDCTIYCIDIEQNNDQIHCLCFFNNKIIRVE